MKKFEHGGDVWHGDPKEWLDFSSNTNALGCPGFVQNALKRALEEVAFYPQVNMHRAVRGISRLVGVAEECVLPTNGGIGALELVISRMSPKRVVALTPSFVEYERISAQHGIAFVGVSMFKDRHTLVFPIEQLTKELQSEDMLVICNPGNPTGFGIGRDILAQVQELVRKRQATMLVDEAFTFFCDGLSIGDMVHDNPKVLIAGSLTKIFAIPGVRLGYVLAQKERIAELKEYQVPWVLSAFATCAAKAATESGDFLCKTKEDLPKTRDKLKADLENLSLFVYESCANYLLTDLKRVEITADELAERLRLDRILVRSCENYHGLDKYHMRVAVKNEVENDKLVCAIDRIFTDCRKGRR